MLSLANMLEKYPIRTLDKIPKVLEEIPDAPKQLFIRGTLPDESFIRLAVVGSRKYTPYGKEAVKKLISGLRGYPVTIVSGLALGIDSIAHEEALANNIKTIAIPGSGLGERAISPQSHLQLAKRILDADGCLLSEYDRDQLAAPWTFPQRNRIMAGISKAVLVIEAEKKSGTMITARLATEYNRDVLAVPGSIFSSSSEGIHLLIRLGATPISSSEDILEALGLATIPNEAKNYEDCSAEEVELIKFISSPKSREEICDSLNTSAQKLGSLLTILELKGIIKESMGKIYLS